MPFSTSVRSNICDYQYHEFNIFENKLIQDFSKKYNATPGQIILNWHIKNGVIPIPGTSKISRMKENLKAQDINIDDKDIEKLSQNCRAIGKKRFWGSRRFFGINTFG